MNTPVKIMCVGFLVTAGLGCDFNTISSQAQAKTVAVSTLLTTSPVTISGAAVAGNGFDASIPAFDGGVDAGGLSLDAGITIPAQNLVSVFFGQRGANLDTAPVGTAGATVSVTEVGGSTWQLADQGGGTYTLLSASDAGFVYRGTATYDFTFVNAGVTYTAEVARVPPPENIAKFHDAPGYITLSVGDSFTFTRPDPAAGEDRQLGFVNVFPISSSGSQGQPTYTNIPKTPLDFLKLVVAPSDWKQSVVTIPASAFPEKDHNYVIVLQSAKLGGPKSDNLFSGSAILAGTADIGVVKTKP